MWWEHGRRRTARRPAARCRAQRRPPCAATPAVATEPAAAAAVRVAAGRWEDEQESRRPSCTMEGQTRRQAALAQAGDGHTGAQQRGAAAHGQ